MKFLAAILILCFPSCLHYKEEFTYYNESGTPNHTVDVSYYNFLIMGKAGRLNTETQTMEFIRNVNASDVESKSDSDAIGSLAEGVAKGIKKF